MNFVDATLLEGKRNPATSLMDPDLAEGRGKTARETDREPPTVHCRSTPRHLSQLPSVLTVRRTFDV